jgi:hypothetical protein
MVEEVERGRRESDLFWMRFGVASLWLLTGILVLHPFYREVGRAYLALLGIPDLVMYLLCAFEVGLGVWILARGVSLRLAWLQTVTVVGFTVVLVASDPKIWVHPFGVLSKNIPFLALVWSAWMLESGGDLSKMRWVLLGGIAFIWLHEGIVPKILFQQAYEREVVARTGLVPMDPSRFLYWLGGAQAFSGVLLLALRGNTLRIVLSAQLIALLALPILVSLWEPDLWFHPFGPMTKNVPIVVATWILLQEEGRSRLAS